jgi:ABC-type multidrug transport system ATPase subunit
LAARQVTDPALMFVDEPTSGLDSFTSLAVIEQVSGGKERVFV